MFDYRTFQDPDPKSHGEWFLYECLPSGHVGQIWSFSNEYQMQEFINNCEAHNSRPVAYS